MKNPQILILEGLWWNNHEVPQILPYFQALGLTDKRLVIGHRSIRSAEDVKYYVSQIPRNTGAMVYFACHGNRSCLEPVDGVSIPQAELAEALKYAKDGAVAFIHFGCCEMVEQKKRRQSHEMIMEAARAKWVSGYTQEIDWLPSTFLDLALVSEIFIKQHGEQDGRVARINQRAEKFYSTYDQTLRTLGFSALSGTSSGTRLFPAALHSPE